MSIPREYSKSLRDRDLCFLDIETTGTVFGVHEIIDLAAIRTSPDGTQIRNVFQHKIAPQHPERSSERARQITGYSISAWRSARKADHSFWTEFASFARECVPVCHNPSFDRAFVTLAASSVEVNDLGLDYHWIGTESLAWPLYLRGHMVQFSLATLCDYLGVEPEPVIHTALNGAQACRRIYLALMSHLCEHLSEHVRSNTYDVLSPNEL